MPTADHLENMRHNIAHYPWARESRDEAITAANRIVDKPFSELAGYVPDPRVPRSIYVHETGCPICGLEQRKHGTASWIISRDKPYKVQCPSCDMVFPSNDFAAFLASGMQDPSLLDGEYPDDGYGWASPRDPEHKYWFVGWYNHWMVMTKDSCGLLSIIDALYHAYLFSDDPRYAHKCAAVLWQMAVNYPAYDYVNQSRIGTEYDPNYHGKLLYHTWETFVVRCCVMAYDAHCSGAGRTVSRARAIHGTDEPTDSAFNRGAAAPRHGRLYRRRDGPYLRQLRHASGGPADDCRRAARYAW